MDRALLRYSVLAYVGTVAALYVLSKIVPQFDLSAEGTFLQRWDAIFFEDISRRGYRHEQQFAFMPGLPMIMRLGSEITRLPPVFVGSVAAGAAFSVATLVLYRLSERMGLPHKTSFTAAILFIFSPSPATLHAAPYTEPFTALLMFLAMECLIGDNIVFASVFLAAATFFRAQVIIASTIFLGWNVLTRTGRVRYESAVGYLGTLAPFIFFQFLAYTLFCVKGTQETRPWCPYFFSYPWIQSEYWNVGLFKYWTFAQIPNFVLAAPVLLVWGLTTYDFYSKTNPELYLPFQDVQPDVLAPYAHYSLAMGCVLLFTSHVQIALRLVVLNPLVYWYLAEAEEKILKYWMYYVGIWSGISLILWAGFYPPA